LDLDYVSWEIIRELRRDGRTTFKRLGDTIGFTGLGAKKRVEKLLEQDVIKVSALVNAEKLNLRLAMVLLETEDVEVTRMIVDRFRDCPRVINFFTTLGGYNLVALVMAEDQDTLESECMENCSLRGCEGIRRSEFYPICNIHYSSFLPVKGYGTSKEGNITPCNVDCRSCLSYQDQKCVGCPATKNYRGPLR
jgi:Lrp/AsnC family leucine-responsive transcriptional regulator